MATREAGDVPGFRSFWERSKRIAASQNLTFVQVEIEHPGESKKSKKTPNTVRKKSSADEHPSDEPESLSPPNRREQVYQAQKRHRKRKNEYSRSLDDEIARLKHTTAVVSSEIHRLADENASIRKHLEFQGLGAEASNVTVASLAYPRGEMRNSTPNVGNMASLLDSGESEMRDASENSVREISKEGSLQDPQIDSLASSRIERCKALLLRDVLPFQNDEQEEKKTWEALAELVLDE